MTNIIMKLLDGTELSYTIPLMMQSDKEKINIKKNNYITAFTFF